MEPPRNGQWDAGQGKGRSKFEGSRESESAVPKEFGLKTSGLVPKEGEKIY